MRLDNVLAEKGITKNQLAMNARITPSDLYAALNGKKPLFPAWRQRIAECLQMDESQLFDEEQKNGNDKVG